MVKNWVLKFFQRSSKIVLEYYRPKIVLISGTLGKTTTKDAIAHIFESKFSVRKTEDNANNEFGVAYTILGIKQADQNVVKVFKLLMLVLRIIKTYPDFLVIEVGTRKVGDIKNSVYYISADVVIITKIASIPSHIEYFKDLEELAKEEFSVCDYLKKDGKIICFDEDAKYLNVPVLCISRNGDSKNSRISNWDFAYTAEGKLEGCRFEFKIKNKDYKVLCKGCGSDSYGLTILFALLAYDLFGELDEVVLKQANLLKITNGRSKIIDGVNRSIIIDDSYNAGPDSVSMALNNLDKIVCSGKKIVVLGEMGELGDYSVQAHADAYDHAKGLSDEVYLTGKAFGQIASQREIGDFLYENLSEGDVVLVKGSQSNRLEVTTQLIAKCQRSVVKNLVRQTEFWKEQLSVVFSTDCVPFYDQNTKENWKEKGFLDESEAHLWSGKSCGISCIKMVAEAFGKENILIANLIRAAVQSNSYRQGVGWIHSKIADFISHRFDLDAYAERGVSIESIRELIESGYLIIASVGFGFHRGKSGHLVVILGFQIREGVISGFYVHHPSINRELCKIREHVPIGKFSSSFSGNIIKIKNKI